MANPDPEMYFRLLVPGVKEAANRSGPRLGRLSLNKVHLETPTFVAPASRGAVPHLSHDNLRDNTNIKGIYVALEDFVEKFPPNVPIYNHHPGTLRTFTSTPPTSLLILSGRRVPPVTTAASNTDHSLAILTSVGFRMLKIDDYTTAAQHLRPDIVLGLADIPQQTPGKQRAPKMVLRTELWLGELIKKTTASATIPGQEKPRIFASLLPLDLEQQSWYIEYLKTQLPSLSGLALYDSRLAVDIPAELETLPRMSLDDPGNPHMVLKQVGWGVDLFNLAFITQLTDAGIALDFQLLGEGEGEGGGQIEDGWRRMEEGQEEEKEEKKRPMAVDLWGVEHATDLGPLGRGCGCYACRKHHRAFVQHLLVTKEMTAWVLLQIHNTAIIDRFFTGIRQSITRGTFEQDQLLFAQTYADEFPEKKGPGPRLRGYQFKSEGGAGKKNPKSFSKFGAVGGTGGGTAGRVVDEVTRGGEVTEEGGFAERLS